MALIQCSECSSQVSDKAAVCPKCGAPISDAPAARATGSPVTTTQQTSKRLKGHQLIAFGLIVAGTVSMCSSTASVSKGGGAVSTGAVVGVLLFLVGGIWYLVARFRTWWHHG